MQKKYNGFLKSKNLKYIKEQRKKKEERKKARKGKLHRTAKTQWRGRSL